MCARVCVTQVPPPSSHTHTQSILAPKKIVSVFFSPFYYTAPVLSSSDPIYLPSQYQRRDWGVYRKSKLGGKMAQHRQRGERMGIARAAERLATAQSGLTHRTLADSCFCSDRAQPRRVAASRCTGWSWGATQMMGGGGSCSRHWGAELHTAACNGPVHPTLACVCFGGAMNTNATPLLEDQTKLFVLLFRDVGVLLFCQPSVRHQYEQRLFPCLLRVHVSCVLSLACCACTSPTC